MQLFKGGGSVQTRGEIGGARAAGTNGAVAPSGWRTKQKASRGFVNPNARALGPGLMPSLEFLGVRARAVGSRTQG